MTIHVLVYTDPNRLTEVTKADLKLLKEAAERKKVNLKIIFARDCQLVLGKKPQVLIDNKKQKINVLLVRPNFLSTNLEFRCAIIKQFELSGIKVINNSLAVLRAKNKLRTLQVLSKCDIPIPKSFVIVSTKYIDEVIKDIGSFPVILKTVTGSHGSGVAIAETKRAVRSVIEMVLGESGNNPIVVQEYIKESRGKDLRVFIVGRKIVGVMERVAQKKGEFRSNFHLGGRVRVAELSRKEKDIAFAAVRACGLDIAGVDLLRTKTGPKVLEVNANPGLQGITEATNIDIAGQIIDFAIKKAIVQINSR
ncbi:MAG: RimK family alpha-L-glutamate ligase [bacterium]